MALLQSLLAAGLYVEAALLCWGNILFNPEPRAVKLVWSALQNHDKILAMGAASQSKTYSAAIWTLLDWVRDPKYTTVKLISTTAGHAKSNIFATIVRRHRESAIPLPGIITEGFLGLDKDDRHSSIEQISIQKGEDGKAALRGFHPLPRPRPHPEFGVMSRSRAILDEAEGIPEGVWMGVDNLTSTGGGGRGMVKVYAATNPIDINSAFGTRAMPLGGWDSIDRDITDEWQGHEGWHVVRLDAAKSENVLQKRKIYEGFMDYEGYMTYVSKGTSHPDYDTMARGRYPLATAQFNVVPQYLFDAAKGIYTWAKLPTPVGSLDPAFEEGGDDPTFTTGLYGLASAFTHSNGQIKLFEIPKWVIQIEQQFPIQKNETPAMAHEVKTICSDLRIRPEWFVMDRTGNAIGLFHTLRLIYGPSILGIMWGESATDKKILEEHIEAANEQFPDVISEMWFAYSMWLEHGFIGHAPMLQTGPMRGKKTGLAGQLTGRRYYRTGKTMRKVQKKLEYKSENEGESPDEADSLIMIPHLIRMRAMHNAAIMPGKSTPRDTEGRAIWRNRESVVDRVEFVNTDV